MMQGASQAIGWMLWRRNRLALLIVFGWLTVGGLACHLMPFDQFYNGICVFLGLPSVFAFIWLLGEFTFGGEFDLTSAASGFPGRMFTLPVRTRALVGWPMLLGGACVGLAWTLISVLLLRSRGLDVPLVWPAIFAAGLLLWVQALTWTPFPAAWVRVWVALIGLVLYVGGVIVACRNDVSEAVLSLSLLILMPLSWGLAVRGVGQARSGVTSSQWTFEWASGLLRSRHRQFRSAAQAQFFFEWRLTGFSMIAVSFAYVVFLVPAAALTGGRAAVMFTAMMFVLPMLGCASLCLAMARFRMEQRIQPMPAFIATRPVTTGELVAAKLRVAAVSVLLSFAVVTVAALLSCLISDAGPVFVRSARDFVSEYSVIEAIGVGVAAVVGMPLLAWLTLASHLWCGLTGKRWVGYAYTTVLGVGFTAICVGALHVYSTPDLHAGALDLLPWLLGVIAGVKVFAVGGLWSTVARRGLLGPKILAAMAGGWAGLVAVLTVVGVSYLLPENLPWHIALSAAVLAVPLMGLALSPLALDYNRHGSLASP